MYNLHCMSGTRPEIVVLPACIIFQVFLLYYLKIQTNILYLLCPSCIYLNLIQGLALIEVYKCEVLLHRTIYRSIFDDLKFKKCKYDHCLYWGFQFTLILFSIQHSVSLEMRCIFLILQMD